MSVDIAEITSTEHDKYIIALRSKGQNVVNRIAIDITTCTDNITEAVS